MVFLSVAEKIYMILIYGEAGRNSAEASRLYAEKRYPEKNHHPSQKSFNRTVQLIRGIVSVNPPKRKRSRPVTGEATEIAVLAAIRKDPHISCRKIKRHGISKFQVYTEYFNVNQFHPFYISLHQELHGIDF